MFVGAPGDGSVFLNSMKLWAMREAGLIDSYQFDLDLTPRSMKPARIIAGDCSITSAPARHADPGRWRAENYNLQPEPALVKCWHPQCARIQLTCRSSARQDRWIASSASGRGGDVGQGR